MRKKSHITYKNGTIRNRHKVIIALYALPKAA